MGLRRPGEPGASARGEKVGGEGGGTPADRQVERRRLAGPSRSLPAGARRKAPVPPEPDLRADILLAQ